MGFLDLFRNRDRPLVHYEEGLGYEEPFDEPSWLASGIDSTGRHIEAEVLGDTEDEALMQASEIFHNLTGGDSFDILSIKRR